ncbi:DUF1269 domain-containing protein [soil metagenome]
MSDDAATEQSDQTLVGLAFDDAFRAQEFLTATARMATRKELELRDAVLITSSDEGRVTVRETRDLQMSTTALSGGLWAGLIGLMLGGPVGWIAGTAVGAASGAVKAKVIDHGIPDEWVDWFRQAVTPGSTIVALLLGDVSQPAALEELRRFSGAHLVYANVPDSLQDRMREALGEPMMHNTASDDTSPADVSAGGGLGEPDVTTRADDPPPTAP